tara:strand:+ start:8584 stop:9006 length:423 start_codon:yes stop_codon:yes gene_type:complete
MSAFVFQQRKMASDDSQIMTVLKDLLGIQGVRYIRGGNTGDRIVDTSFVTRVGLADWIYRCAIETSTSFPKFKKSSDQTNVGREAIDIVNQVMYIVAMHSLAEMATKRGDKGNFMQDAFDIAAGVAIKDGIETAIESTPK